MVGETPNLAARLQSLAEPGAVVIGEGTRNILGAIFDLEDRGAHALKGFTQPVRAWRVLGEGRAEGRFEALRRWSDVTRNSRYCWTAGSWRKAERARLSSSPGKPGSASRG